MQDFYELTNNLQFHLTSLIILRWVGGSGPNFGQLKSEVNHVFATLF